MLERDQLSYTSVALSMRPNITDEQMQEVALAYYQTMQKRYTVCEFTPREVPDEVIQHCIRTAGSAPSASQPPALTFCGYS